MLAFASLLPHNTYSSSHTAAVKAENRPRRQAADTDVLNVKIVEASLTASR